MGFHRDLGKKIVDDLISTLNLMLNVTMATPGIFIWGKRPRESRDRGPPMEFRGEAPVGSLWTSPKAEAVYRHCLQNLTTKTIKI